VFARAAFAFYKVNVGAAHQSIAIRSYDHTPLVLQRWSPASQDGPVSAQLLIIPGYADHASRYREFAHFLAEGGVEVFAVDLRGHGESSGQRGFVECFEHYLDDVGAALAETNPTLPRFLLGHSMGGLIALDYVAERAPQLAGLVVTNPFLALAMAVPPWKLLAGNLAARVLPRLALPSGINAVDISHDDAIIERYRNDPLVFGQATAGWFREIQAAQRRVRARSSLTVPLLYCYSDGDKIASPSANRDMSECLTAPSKEVLLRPGEYHEVLNEIDRLSLYRHIGGFLAQGAKSARRS